MNPSLVLTATQKKIRFKRSLKKHKLISSSKSSGEAGYKCNRVDDIAEVDGEQLRNKTHNRFQDGLGMQLGDFRKYNFDEKYFRNTPMQATMSNIHSRLEGGERGNV